MRRSRFAKPDETNELRDSASIADACWFDLSRPETSDEDSLSEWRVAGLQHAPLLLGATHVLITVTLYVLSATRQYCLCADNPQIPSVLVIVLDAMAAGLLVTRNKFNFAPHTVIRCLGIYLALVGALWTWFGWAVADDQFVTPIAAAPIAMAAGIAMGTIVSMNSPPLAVVNIAVSIAAAIVLAGSPLIPGGVAILSLALIAYSISTARSFITAGRKRLLVEAQARKAQNFVDEFENTGRGWFWETDY